ncbi:MAG: hypothetical protein JWP27_2795 [Flaviaesturariibacter sp.]|nr:hypothetical protein [Flaviaesturariibacter sp.]
MSKAPLTIFSAVAILQLLACGAEESRPRRPAADVRTIYVEHAIRGSEDREDVTVTLQFRKGVSGTNMGLGTGGVELDGNPLAGDSSALGGVFYDATIPAVSAPGMHVITYMGPRGPVADTFVFRPFSVPPTLAGLRRGTDWSVAVSGLPNGTGVLVALTDTAFLTNDIVETVPVSGGMIRLRAARLQKLATGPVLLELSSVDSHPPANGAKGQIRVEYSVRRELLLKDR